MRARSMYVLAGVLYFCSISVAHAAALPKLAASIVTTDDCFTSYTGAANQCDLGWCLSSVAGDSDAAKIDKYKLCASGEPVRTVASQETCEEKKTE